ncbi:hypothetical protein AMST5_00693 [freshwater sediment metagenome]|uniref:AlgX/AlgJ SGNH hydrolase-like domain-containing protein n=1 Tax=freshwater sediment metagenome TaxID=556182 RepID=A0AA48LXE1_9ZZZZ
MTRSIPIKILSAVAIAGAAIYAVLNFVQPSRYIVLLIVAIVFVTFVYFIAILRGRWRDFALLCATLSLGFGIIETLSLHLGGFATTYKDRGSWARVGELGWRPARPGPIHEKKIATNGDVVYDVVNTIDDNLTRKVESAPDGPTVAFFGDSITFGAGLNDNETLPQAFADLTDRRFRVLNLAVTAYGPQQFLRALEIGEHDALLKKDPRLFIMLTAPWHAGRTSCKERNQWYAPRYVIEDGAPVYRGACSEAASGLFGAARALLRSTEMFHYFFESREPPIDEKDVDLYVAVLGKAGEVARQKYGVPTLIMYLPDNFATDRYQLGPAYGNAQIMQKLRATGLHVAEARLVNAADYPGQPLFIPGDGHPTGLMDRIWAGQIRDVVMQEFNAASWR